MARPVRIVGLGGSLRAGSTSRTALQAAHEFADASYACDAMIWSSPTYQGSVSGSFKNAMDWLILLADRTPPYLSNTPIGLVSTAGGVQGLQRGAAGGPGPEGTAQAHDPDRPRHRVSFTRPAIILCRADAPSWGQPAGSQHLRSCASAGVARDAIHGTGPDHPGRHATARSSRRRPRTRRVTWGTSISPP